MKKTILSLALLAALPLAGHAQIRITEWMYNGLSAGSTGEFVELTDVGTTAINMTGWSFDDSSRTAGSTSLSAFGIINPGQSVIFTDLSASAFRSLWSLSASVPVIGGNLDNLGRGDEINIYNGSTLVDRLTYDDQGTGTVKGPRTSGISANPNSLVVLGANTANAWSFSSVGDSFGSTADSLGEIANPGVYAPVVPEPGTWALAGMGFASLLIFRRRK